MTRPYRDQDIYDLNYYAAENEGLQEVIDGLTEDLSDSRVEVQELKTKLSLYETGKMPLVRIGPGCGYYHDILAKDVQKKWSGFEPLVIATVVSCSAVSFLWGMWF